MRLIDELEDAIYLILYNINHSGGFTVMVWYKWGVIGDHKNNTESFYIKLKQDILQITLFQFSWLTIC